MSILGKDAILGANDLKAIEVEVPEWGGSVSLRVLTAADRERYIGKMLKAHKKDEMPHEGFQPELVALCLVGEDGKRLFTSAEDIKTLGEKNAAVVDRLYKEAEKLNGLSADSTEEALKNSGNPQTEDSASA